MTNKAALRDTAIGLALSSIAFAAQAQTLSPQAAQDLARVFAPSPAQAARFGNAISTQSLRLNAQVQAAGLVKNPTCILPNIGAATAPATTPRDVFSEWHCVALNLLAVDHIPQNNPTTGAPVHYQEFGPHRSSYAMAMFHLAMYEVANAFASKAHMHSSWIAAKWPGVSVPVPAGASESAALVQAAYTMLLHLYPNFKNDGNYGSLEDNYQNALTAIKADPSSGDISKGMAFGEAIANVIIGIRANDGSQVPEAMWFVDFFPKKPITDEFQWSPDPVSRIQVALGYHWGEVTPFVIGNVDDFPLPAPITDDLSPTFTAYYKEVKESGGDGRYHVDVSARDMEKYLQGKFWSYDGTAGICAPVRLYNQIADTILVEYYHDIASGAPDLNAKDAGTDAASDMAHYYEMLNVAMVDAGIVAWHIKYVYQYWRPVNMIRYVEAQRSGAAPSDNFEHETLPWGPVWYALGAQNTNSAAGYNITPPFPAYPSGHSVFGGAFFEVMRSLFNSDMKPFDIQSDELNGEQRLGNNVDAFNYVRCAKPTASTPDPDYDPKLCDFKANTKKHFPTFTDAQQQNSDSRVYLGVHWRGDTDIGISLGVDIGKAVVKQQLALVGS